KAGTPTFEAIVDRFGTEVAGREEIDRPALGDVVFGDPDAMAALEDIVHPAVAAEIRKLLRQPSDAPATVIEAIKLVESETVALIDELWIVTASREARLKRLAESRDLESSEAAKRVDAQSSDEAKIRLFERRRPGAPVVLIDNDGSLDRTRNAVLAAWRAFIESDGG
ncbi:MAG: dephospho-CoA kinase, partial [Chloroflexi bacterium]|nr:dephospho-CoA kinase [Chloroflexota bacterium]